MDKAEVDRWLQAYVGAWKSYAPDQIGELFSEDVRYRYHPHDDPVAGRAALVRSWLGESDGASGSSGRDEPGTYDATYRAVAVDGDVAVATGSSTYLSGPGGPVEKVFDNCFVMRFDAEGRCREFTEWYLERPRGAGLLLPEGFSRCCPQPGPADTAWMPLPCCSSDMNAAFMSYPRAARTYQQSQQSLRAQE